MSGGLKHFSKEHMQKGNWYMKRCFTSLIIGEMKIKIPMRHHFTPFRMAITIKTRDNRCRWECGDKGTIMHCWRECKLVQPKEMKTHSSILAWKIPQTKELGRLQSMRSQRVGHDWVTSLTMENSMEVPQKKKKMRNRTTILPKGPFLGIYLEEIKSVSQRDTCIPMFITLFTITKIWKGFYGNHKN